MSVLSHKDGERMSIEQLLEGINYLTQQSRQRPLTVDELALQKALRASYLAMIRKSFRSQIEKVRVIDIEGNDVTPNAVRQKQVSANLSESLPDRVAAFLKTIPEE